MIAGSDSGAGAGLQADLKTISALGAYATTAVTAVTAQNTHGVFGVALMEPAFVARQIRLVLEDIGADAVKIGMLGSAAIVAAVAHALEGVAAPLVLDTVMVAKGGHGLSDAPAVAALRELLLPRAALVTPNIPEAEALSNVAIAGLDDMRHAARVLRGAGAAAVLVKGGHGAGNLVQDLLVHAGGEAVFEAPWQASRHTHGTGCTLASAIAAGLAGGLALEPAVAAAHAYVQRAIAAAPGIGGGHGPLGHFGH